MLKKIPVSDVRPGMFIQKLGDSWLTHPFWRGSFLLEEADDLAKIRKSGIAEVWIDTDRGLDGPDTRSPVLDNADPLPAPPVECPETRDPSIDRASLAAELGRAQRLYEGSKARMRAMFAEARLGRAINTEGVQTLVEEISASVQRNPWALITVARLKTADEYTYMHSVAVCALMIALARQLGLPAHDTREIGAAGLFHDIGKAQIPAEILNKPGKLTEQEFRIMATHPANGIMILSNYPWATNDIRNCAFQHHEKFGGQGYPMGLKGPQIAELAQVVSIVDFYDALISDRVYKKGLPPNVVYQAIMNGVNQHFDARIVQAFLKFIVPYPVNSQVLLSTGQSARVMRVNRKALLSPVVVVEGQGELDLARHPEIAITTIERVAREHPTFFNAPAGKGAPRGRGLPER